MFPPRCVPNPSCSVCLVLIAPANTQGKKPAWESLVSSQGDAPRSGHGDPNLTAITGGEGTWRLRVTETRSHNWIEGARIGEAQNPGPGGRGHGRRAKSQDPSWHRARGASSGVLADHQPGVGRHTTIPAVIPRNNPTNMYATTIGTLGNDGQLGAEDLRPEWHAGSQPQSQHPTRGGSSRVRADHQHGVYGHANNPPLSPLSSRPTSTLNELGRQLVYIQSQVDTLCALVQSWSSRSNPSTTPSHHLLGGTTQSPFSGAILGSNSNQPPRGLCLGRGETSAHSTGAGGSTATASPTRARRTAATGVPWLIGAGISGPTDLAGCGWA